MDIGADWGWTDAGQLKGFGVFTLGASRGTQFNLELENLSSPWGLALVASGSVVWDER